MNELINSEKFSQNEEFVKIEIQEKIIPILMKFNLNSKLMSFVIQIMADQFKQQRNNPLSVDLLEYEDMA